jgi:branched-chain amino acid transport system permease protein
MQLALNIVVLASIYALIACGYVLIYRVSRVLSLAHGELMMVGAYALLSTAGLFRQWPWVAIGVSLLLAAVVGVLIYVLLMRRMTGEQVLSAVLTTIALGILLRGLMTLFYSAQQQYPLTDLGLVNAAIALPGGARVSTVGLILILSTASVYLGLYAFLRFSPAGIRIRAAGQNPLLAAQRGINLHAVYALTWAMAVFTGGLAGMLIACDSGLDATMTTIGLKAFPAALVGGLDSLAGALLGSLIIAAAEVLLIHYVDPLLSDVVPFLVLTATLMLRPWGLLGSREELDRV